MLNSGDSVQFPKIQDARGNLSFIEGDVHVPFPIKRVYYLYDVPEGAERGGHAHRKLQQAVIALSGSFDLILDDGTGRKRIHLNQPNQGILIGNNVWREMENFSEGCVCLVLASERYDEADYIRDYNEFLQWIRK